MPSLWIVVNRPIPMNRQMEVHTMACIHSLNGFKFIVSIPGRKRTAVFFHTIPGTHAGMYFTA